MIGEKRNTYSRKPDNAVAKMMKRLRDKPLKAIRCNKRPDSETGKSGFQGYRFKLYPSEIKRVPNCYLVNCTDCGEKIWIGDPKAVDCNG